MKALDSLTRRALMRRMLTGVLASVLFGFMVWIAQRFGAIQWSVMLLIELVVVMLVAGYYGIVQLGWNARFKDPSLTLPTLLAAASVNSMLLFWAEFGRGAFLAVYFITMLCGVFKLNTRQLLILAAYQLLAYALVIYALFALAPQRVDLHLEAMQWLLLAFALLWFAYMCGYINSLIVRAGEAEFDDLTGAHSRRRIIEIFRHEKLRADRSAGPLSICMVDIDRMKSVNDRFGHSGGDRQLKLVVAAVQHELRNIDYIGRYGGDEFLVILTETPLRGALECAERIRRTLERMSSQADAVTATVSIGIAEYLPGETLTHVVERADAALYTAKNRGRDRVECALPEAITPG